MRYDVVSRGCCRKLGLMLIDAVPSDSISVSVRIGDQRRFRLCYCLADYNTDDLAYRASFLLADNRICRRWNHKAEGKRMRKVNSRFHTDGEQIVKTSNGQPVPPEEPVFILRGRDNLALGILTVYTIMAKINGCNNQFLEEMTVPLKEFEDFAKKYPSLMKQPGVTGGK